MLPVLAPILAQAITFAAGDRTEVRTRLNDVDAYFDVETRPSLELELRTPRTSWTLTYFPSLIFLAVGDSTYNEVLLLHSARASSTFRWPRTSLRLSQSGSYGERNFQVAALSAPETGPDTAAPEPTPADPNAPAQPPTTPPTTTPTTVVPDALRTNLQTLSYVSSRSQADLSYALSRRWTFGILGGYEVQGGLGREARGFYPLQRGPLGQLRLTFRSSPIDSLTSEVQGQYVDSKGGQISGDRQAVLAIADERWVHEFSVNARSDLSAGIGYTRFKPEGGKTDNDLHPFANAGLQHRLYKADFALEAEYAVRLSPVIDRNTGAVDRRFQWLTQLTWTRDQLSFLLNLVGVESLERDTVLSLTSYTGSFAMRYELTNEFAFDTGVRAFWQRAGINPESTVGGTLFAGLTYAMQPEPL
jgi:hypothetical protein